MANGSAHGGNERLTKGGSAIAANLSLAAVYFCAGKFGLSMALINASASAVWPPSGLAAAALLLWGPRLWPGICLGAFLVNITTQGTFFTALAIAGGNTLEALAAASLARRFAGGLNAFERVANILRFVFLAAMLSTTISATFGVTSLCLGGFSRWNQFGTVWLTWWLGDWVSDLIIVPLALIWRRLGIPRWSLAQGAEAAGLFLIMVLMGGFLFLPTNALSRTHCPLEYLAIPPLLWAAFRFGERGAITCAFVMSAIALWGTLHNTGPFVRANANESLLLLQAFLGTSTLTALVLASLSSERKQTEEALAASRQRLAAILESAMDAIITVDDQQRIVLFNPAAERMFRCPAARAMGGPLDQFIPPRFRQAHSQHVYRFGKTGQTPRAMGPLGMLSGLRADGEEFPIEASISQVRVGQHTLFSVIIRDITRRNQAEAALRQARQELERTNEELERKVEERTAKLQEMMGELEHFSYAIVHDMRAPLRAMQSFASLAEEALNGSYQPEITDFLHRIQTSASRMDNLIQDALNYNRVVLEKLPLVPVDLEELLSGMLKSYPELQPPRALIQFEGALPVVLGNVSGLTQCFSNLLGNAVKFVAPGVRPRVRVWAESRGVECESVRASEHGPTAPKSTLHAPDAPRVRIWVEDNGIGIPKEWQQRIFDMFQRVNPGQDGTGIGLAIVRKVVERMDGRAGVESEPGMGSRFWVEFRAPKSDADWLSVGG